MAIEEIRPEDIEKKSFAIIAEELEQRRIALDERYRSVIMRCIHTTADFDYARTLAFSDHAIERAKEALQAGADIVTDTRMAMAGINKKALARFGGQVHCFMAGDEVAAAAKRRGVTRAMVSMEYAARLERPVVFAIGNAPTALIQLNRLMDEGYEPAFVIGVPVGFVNVEAAKELILQSGIPYIVNRGRKGGSTVAAAICNAILYDL